MYKLSGLILFLGLLCFTLGKEATKSPPVSLRRSFHISKESIQVSKEGASITLEFYSRDNVSVYWKEIILSQDAKKQPYWIPVQDDKKITNTIKKLSKYYFGRSMLKLDDSDKMSTAIVAMFYNRDGNVLYEYIPNLFKESQDNHVSKKVQKKNKKKMAPTEVIDILQNPSMVQYIKTGQEAKATCSFLAPPDSKPKFEWVRVQYTTVNNETKEFDKNVTVLMSELNVVDNDALSDKVIDIKTERTSTAFGKVVTSTLTINPFTKDHEGVYTCHMVEKKATPYTYISAYTEILPIGKKSTFEENSVYIKFFPCKGTIYEPAKKDDIPTVTIKKASPNCFSCGGYGFPKPVLNLYKDGRIIPHSHPHLKQVNMGQDVRAIMYAIPDPEAEDEGNYSCRASNGVKETAWDFAVTVE